MDFEQQNSTQNIYKASRSIKKSDNTLYNALLSIHQDSIFVGEISQLWPQLPLLANLRCGLWYYPRFHGTCYFKSTDGHTNNCSFNTSRLNLHVAQLAGNKGGCVIVDSTRKGKRFPDSMSKTIPIWTCVLNRAIKRYRSMMHENEVVNHMNTLTNHEIDENMLNNWDCSLHLPLWVSKTEKASIENRLDMFSSLLEESGADIASLAKSLRKPLRPLWISQKSVIWLNEVPDHDSCDFTPIILVSASSSNSFLTKKTSSEFSWNYIPGAGDDEESWARGLTPTLFWNHVYEIINCGPDSCNQKVSEIVEKDRVYRAQRGQNAPQVLIKSQKIKENNGYYEYALHSKFESMGVSEISTNEESSTISWLGLTNIAVGTTQDAATKPNVDCILNCGKELLTVDHSYVYLHLPVVSSKLDRFSLLNKLPSAMKFARLNVMQGRSLLVCCDDGLFDDGKSFKETEVTKLEMRRRLVYICKYSTNARPSRGNLRQVFGFLNPGKNELDS
ncbi:Uncharacterized protein RDABS01_034435 [Bienertia sinuspersici]